MQLAESIRQRIESARHWLNRLRAIYDSEGVGEEFILPVLEDRELLGLTRNLGTAGYVQWCCWDAALGYIFVSSADT